ncbi:MAG: hypothetical protein WHS88_05360 [Anaerohalosphaeraceae bacterium]
MNKRIVILTTMMMLGGYAFADAVFVPPVADIYDLDHYYAYTWGINLGFKTTDTPIVAAELVFKEIYNWRVEEDHLYVTLLDNAPLGLKWYWDGQGGGNFFAGQGLLLIDWNDPEEWNQTKDLVITFDAAQLAALNAYGADGKIGFGFDPDCHYYNKGIQFKVVTAAVPAPGAVMLGSVGMLLVGWLRTRRSL